MRFKDWTVKELVVFLTGNALFGKVGDSVLDYSLRDERGLVSGELLFRVNPQKLVDKNESEESGNE